MEGTSWTCVLEIPVYHQICGALLRVAKRHCLQQKGKNAFILPRHSMKNMLPPSVNLGNVSTAHVKINSKRVCWGGGGVQT